MVGFRAGPKPASICDNYTNPAKEVEFDDGVVFYSKFSKLRILSLLLCPLKTRANYTAIKSRFLEGFLRDVVSKNIVLGVVGIFRFGSIGGDNIPLAEIFQAAYPLCFGRVPDSLEDLGGSTLHRA